MRRAARIDDNQKEIVDALRKRGWSVAVTSSLGAGFPDLVVGAGGANFLLEVKDGKKIPSKQRLTPDELRFVNDWQGSVAVVNSPHAAVAAVLGICPQCMEVDCECEQTSGQVR